MESRWRMNRRKVGTEYENRAAAYLEAGGYRILHRNYRCRLGELDLVALDGEVLVFVEVKYRSGRGRGGALEAVDPGKQKILGKTASFYLMKEYGTMDVPCRFDVVGIDGEKICHIRDAFWLTDDPG